MSNGFQQKRYDALICLMGKSFGTDEQAGKPDRDPQRLIQHYLNNQKLLRADQAEGPMLLYGMPSPAASFGKKGDFYLEADAGFLWGPKPADHGWQDMMPLHDEHEASDAFVKASLGVSGVIR